MEARKIAVNGSESRTSYLAALFWSLVTGGAYVGGIGGIVLVVILLLAPSENIGLHGASIPLMDTWARAYIQWIPAAGLVGTAFWHHFHGRSSSGRFDCGRYVTLILWITIGLSLWYGHSYNAVKVMQKVDVIDVEVVAKDAYTEEVLKADLGRIGTGRPFPIWRDIYSTGPLDRRIHVQCVDVGAARFPISAEGYTSKMVRAEPGQKEVVVRLSPKSRKKKICPPDKGGRGAENSP